MSAEFRARPRGHPGAALSPIEDVDRAERREILEVSLVGAVVDSLTEQGDRRAADLDEEAEGRLADGWAAERAEVGHLDERA